MMPKRVRSMPMLFLLVLLAVGSFGCEAPPEEVPQTGADGAVETVDLRTVEYPPGLEIDLDRMNTTTSGVHYRDDTEGNGAVAEAGRTVVVHYTGYLTDGSVFDTSREAGEPLVAGLGANQVITGFDEGLQGMREGGERTLVIPPHLAYGPSGAGDVIPPNAVLTFEVELMEVR